MSYNVNILGLKELQATFDKLPKEVQTKASAVIDTGAKEWVSLAKKAAPVNKHPNILGGNLHQFISYAKLQPLLFEVVSGALYSPYVEWGTITHVSVPAELQAYAIQFKGKGIRKTGGMYPQPFFFIHQLPVKAFIEKGIEANINEIRL